MWYKIDYNRLGILLLPTFLRNQNIVTFVQVLLKPIDIIYYIWYNWRIDTMYKLEHTGQICSFRGSLNDRFDPLQRRIYIGDGQLHKPTYIYTESENKNKYAYTKEESGTIWLRTEEETADSGLDFIVFVPQEIYNSQIHELHAHIKFYKAGGKRYTILIISSNEHIKI